MADKIKLDDKEYEVDNLNDKAKALLSNMQFATKRIQELSNMQSLLQCAKNSYLNSLKKEMVSKKAGLILSDE